MLSFSSGLVLAFRRISTQIEKHGLVKTLCFDSRAQKTHVCKKGSLTSNQLLLTLILRSILLQTVNIHVFIVNHLNYISWTIYFSGLSIVIVVCLLFFFGLHETIVW